MHAHHWHHAGKGDVHKLQQIVPWNTAVHVCHDAYQTLLNAKQKYSDTINKLAPEPALNEVQGGLHPQGSRHVHPGDSVLCSRDKAELVGPISMLRSTISSDTDSTNAFPTYGSQVSSSETTSTLELSTAITHSKLDMSAFRQQTRPAGSKWHSSRVCNGPPKICLRCLDQLTKLVHLRHTQHTRSFSEAAIAR